MRNKKFLLGLLLLLGVGFATVSTTLLMTGNVSISTNNDDFDVIFTSAILDGTDISSTAILDGGKTIIFGTRDLVTVGDKSILNFDIINKSTMYDATVSIECSPSRTEYYEVSSEVVTPIAAKSRQSGKVEVNVLKATTEDIQEPFTCILKSNAIERNTKAEEKPIILGYAPKYFAVDSPTTSSTTDFTTLGKDVFIGLDKDDGQYSVCIKRNMEVTCFRNDNYDNTVSRIKKVLGEDKCTTDWSYIECSDGHFTCGINGARVLGCTGLNNPYFCKITRDGPVGCV